MLRSNEGKLVPAIDSLPEWVSKRRSRGQGIGIYWLGEWGSECCRHIWHSPIWVNLVLGTSLSASALDAFALGGPSVPAGCLYHYVLSCETVQGCRSTFYVWFKKIDGKLEAIKAFHRPAAVLPAHT